ncbi:MAG: hypothetical protein RL077_1714 [Verrucomicrobiota bacterium]|jgi:hypothetical protein
MKRYRDCQSCGHPLSRDPQGGGTEADGTRSSMYCRQCYEAGQFLLPDLSASEMQDRVRADLIATGFPRLFTGFHTRKIPLLERWQPTP